MNSRKVVNENVAITALAFTKNLETYPRRMEYQGRTYNFIEAGLRCLVKHKERIAQIVTMSDEEADYQLKYDQVNANWTLLAITSRG